LGRPSCQVPTYADRAFNRSVWGQSIDDVGDEEPEEAIATLDFPVFSKAKGEYGEPTLFDACSPGTGCFNG
jgi:hypothetical protein